MGNRTSKDHHPGHLSGMSGPPALEFARRLWGARPVSLDFDITGYDMAILCWLVV